MTDFAVSWNLSRQRFVNAVSGLSAAQLNWRLHPESLTIGEAALHVAGVEMWFISQLTGTGLTEADLRIASAATEGVVNDQPFPFAADEITPGFVDEVLLAAKNFVEPIITDPTPDLLQKEIKSALGPIITGQGALARLAFHPGYHQGQAHLLLTAPGFPSS